VDVVLSGIMFLFVLAVSVALFLAFFRLVLSKAEYMERALYFSLGFVFFAWLKLWTYGAARSLLDALST
jgi:hypothetical protein